MMKTLKISQIEKDFKAGSVDCEPYLKIGYQIYKKLPNVPRAHLLAALTTVVAALLGDENKDWRDEWVTRFARMTQHQVDCMPSAKR